MKKIILLIFLLVFSLFILLAIGFGVKVNVLENGFLIFDKNKYLLCTNNNLDKKTIYIKEQNKLFETKCELINKHNNYSTYSLITYLEFGDNLKKVMFSVKKISLFLYVIRKE